MKKKFRYDKNSYGKMLLPTTTKIEHSDRLMDLCFSTDRKYCNHKGESLCTVCAYNDSFPDNIEWYKSFEVEIKLGKLGL